MFSIIRRAWHWLTGTRQRDEFRRHEEQIAARQRELQAAIARRCRQTDGRM